ncbi:MAG: hypothetical protein ACP5GF_14170, partial [Thiomonas sp.]
LESIDWANTMCLAHHAQFDGLILWEHYGVKPAFWLDTLSMARALHGAEAGNSLAKLAERYGLGQKGEEVIHAKGKRLADFSPAELAKYGQYCINDVELTYALFKALLKADGYPTRFPQSELELIDLTVRLFTEPVLDLDSELLTRVYHEAVRRREEFLLKAGVTDEMLRSA